MTWEWQAFSIKDIGRVVTGSTPSSNTPEHFGSYMPFVTPSDMDGQRIINNPERWLSKDGAESLSTRIIPQGVGVSCIGWQMGKVILIPYFWTKTFKQKGFL